MTTPKPNPEPFDVWLKGYLKIEQDDSRIKLMRDAWQAAQVLNENDTVEYWRSRAITAELKVQSFREEIEKLRVAEGEQLREALEVAKLALRNGSSLEQRYRAHETVVRALAASAEKPEPILRPQRAEESDGDAS